MKVTAYKSPYTGELFESEEEFEKHMQLKKEQEEKFLSDEERRNEPRLTATSIEEFLNKAKVAINKGLTNDNWKIEGILIEQIDFHSGKEKYTAHINVVFNRIVNHSYLGCISYFPGVDVNTSPYLTEGTLFKLCVSFHLANFPLIREKFLRLEELKEERNKYMKGVRKMTKEACDADTVIAGLETRHSTLLDQIDSLNEEIMQVQRQLKTLGEEHENRIVKENPFEAYEEYKELYEKFKTN